MEIKVNDYVRTKAFGIKKVKYFEGEEPILENGFTALQSDGYKSSPNIIDLIEVGDYVNGKEIEQIINNELYFEANDMASKISFKEKDIKSIVTKEMYSNVEYRVENN